MIQQKLQKNKHTKSGSANDADLRSGVDIVQDVIRAFFHSFIEHAGIFKIISPAPFQKSETIFFLSYLLLSINEDIFLVFFSSFLPAIPWLTSPEQNNVLFGQLFESPKLAKTLLKVVQVLKANLPGNCSKLKSGISSFMTAVMYCPLRSLDHTSSLWGKIMITSIFP